MKNKLTKFEDLKGHVLKGVSIEGHDECSWLEWTGTTERIIFSLADGDKYKLYHEQDCCENCYLVEIVGSLVDLIGVPLLLVEEITHEQNEWPIEIPDSQRPDSFTWTFYKLSTKKGHVTLRWCGESNGYYSEEVDFAKVDENE